MPQIYTPERVKRIVEDETGFEYRLLEIDEIAKRNPLSNKEQKRMMTIEHLECGHRYTLDIYEFIHGKRRCANCVKGKTLNEHFSFTKEEIISKTNELTNGEYSFMDENYHNSNTLHKYKHHNCGTIFEKKWSKFKDGQRCPKCYKHGMDSMASGYLQDILEFYNVDYEIEKRFEDCINPKTSKVLPFDYFIEKSRLLIEVDGEQHERPSYGKDTFDELKERDRIKDEYARDHGYKLLRIPAKEFNKIPEYGAEILSNYFQKKIDSIIVAQVKQSTNIQRVNKDLKKIKDGEFELHDNYYTGIDRKHKFIHKTCGNVFESTLYLVKYYKDPCVVCRNANQTKRKFDKTQKELSKRTNGRYVLVADDMAVSKDLKRLVQCNKCGYIWYVSIASIYSNNGGCPNCVARARWEQWHHRFTELETQVSSQGKLSTSDYNWLSRNKKLFQKGELDKEREVLMYRLMQQL